MKKIDKMGQIYSKIRLNTIKKKPPYNSKGKIYASKLGTSCDWQLRFQFIGEPEDLNKFIWDGYEADIGNFIHDVIQKEAASEGMLHSAETWDSLTVDGTKINFRIDGIFVDGRLVEYKTIKDNDATDLERKPKQEHVVQANFYLGVKKIDCVLLSYFKRSNGKHVVTWEIDFDQELYNRTIDKIKRIISGTDLVKDNSDCNFCVYKDACKRK
jgi:CRISPR/Cas system-associated exonuclease Cas4 (RecB family)